MRGERAVFCVTDSRDRDGTSMQPRDIAQASLRELGEQASMLRQRAEQMQAELMAVSETVESRDGIATVTVGAGGIMRDVHIGGGSAATPERVRQSIMSAYQQGCRVVGEKAADITERYAPGSPAVAMMRDAIPPDPDSEDGPTEGTSQPGTRGGWTR